MVKTISKRIIRLLATGLIGSVLFWCPAGAQSGPTVAEALVRAHQARLPDSVVIQVMGLALDAGFGRSAAARTIIVLAEAHQADYDLRPFRQRIEEGIAKRIEGERIAAVLEARLQRQMLVSDRLPHDKKTDAPVYQAAVVSLSDALEMGLTPQDVDVLVRRAGNAPVTMTAVAGEMWALLKQLNFDPTLTDRMLSEGLAQRALHPAWRNFPQIVVIARQKGVPDEETAAEALQSLGTGGAPADLLGRLGFTGRNLRTGPMGKEDGAANHP
jgi:hypothetical protein